MGKRATGRRGKPVRSEADMPKINVDALWLYRAQFAGDPVAVAAWARMKARRDELKAQGMPHAQAVDVAMAEL